MLVLQTILKIIGLCKQVMCGVLFLETFFSQKKGIWTIITKSHFHTFDTVFLDHASTQFVTQGSHVSWTNRRWLRQRPNAKEVLAISFFIFPSRHFALNHIYCFIQKRIVCPLTINYRFCSAKSYFCLYGNATLLMNSKWTGRLLCTSLYWREWVPFQIWEILIGELYC